MCTQMACWLGFKRRAHRSLKSRFVQTEILARPTHLRGVRSVDAVSTHRFDKHCHDEFGLGILVSGAQQSASGIGAVEARAGDVITVNYGEVHDGAPLGDQPRRWRMLYFEPELLKERFLKDGALPSIEQFEFVAPVVHNPALFRDVLELTHLLNLPQCEEGKQQVEELFLSIFGELNKAGGLGSNSDDAGDLDAVVRFMERNLYDKLSLHDIANVVGLSPYQLIRACKKVYGLTPHRLLVQKRLDAARRLISSGAPLAEAAIDVGFADQSHMTRLFRRKYGLTPNAFSARS